MNWKWVFQCSNDKNFKARICFGPNKKNAGKFFLAGNFFFDFWNIYFDPFFKKKNFFLGGGKLFFFDFWNIYFDPFFC